MAAVSPEGQIDSQDQIDQSSTGVITLGSIQQSETTSNKHVPAVVDGIEPIGKVEPSPAIAEKSCPPSESVKLPTVPCNVASNGHCMPSEHLDGLSFPDMQVGNSHGVNGNASFAKPEPPLILTPALHLLDCEIGELSLTDEEVQVLQPFLLGCSWRLVASCSVRKQFSKASKNSARPSRRIKQELEALQSACDFSNIEGPRRRQKRVSSRYEDASGGQDKRIRARGCSSGAEASVVSTKSGDFSQVSVTRTRKRGTRRESGEWVASQGAASALRNSKRKGLEKYADSMDDSDGCVASEHLSPSGGRPRRILASTRWRDSCLSILRHLKTLQAAQWFVAPVDPEADEVPDYLDVVQHPMDLQTVENKLLQGGYHNPFSWQQDVRQVFFNAFSYHVMTSQVWLDASALALEFERCCKLIDEVNPYAEVISDNDELATFLPTGRAMDLCIHNVDDIQYNYMSTPNTAKEKRATVEQQMELGPPVASLLDGLSPQHTYGSNLQSSKSKGRVRRPQRQDDYGEDTFDHFRSNSKRAPVVTSPRRASSRGRGRVLRNVSAVRAPNSTVDAAGSVGHQTSTPSEALQVFEAPADGVVLPPPPVPRIGVNDRPLSTSQRRTLQNHLQLLAPQQRHAALELIQDDLGILAADHMYDNSFTFDAELLSIEKQKRLFAYVNSMVRANRELLMNRGLLGAPTGDATRNNSSKNVLSIEGHEGAANSRQNPVDQPAEVASSSSDSDSSSTSSSDSLSSTSDSDADSDDHGSIRSSNAVAAAPPGESTSDAHASFGETVSSTDRTGAVQKGLPEYRPVAEDGEAVQIREELMGRHADFLGVIDSQHAEDALAVTPQEAKSTAWQEWKGQVIQQGFAAERALAPQRSASEIIAEGYDARI